MDLGKYQHDLTLISTRKDGSAARGHWLARYPRESSMRVGVIAGGVMATAILLGLSSVPTAHADDLITTLEADALSYLPLNVQALILSALGDAIPSGELDRLSEAHAFLNSAGADFWNVILSPTEIGTEVSDVIPGTSGDIPGTSIAVPTTPADIVSVGQTLSTELHTDIADAANTGYTNYLQDAATTAGSLAWLGAEATNIDIYNDLLTNPHYYLYAGETAPIMLAETNFLTQIVNSFQGLTLPEGYVNSTLATAFNQDVVYETDINNAIIGNPGLSSDGLIYDGVTDNVHTSQLIPLLTDAASMLTYDIDLYHEALWTADVSALAGLF
jgi:hypothetical protein